MNDYLGFYVIGICTKWRLQRGWNRHVLSHKAQQDLFNGGYLRSKNQQGAHHLGPHHQLHGDGQAEIHHHLKRINALVTLVRASNHWSLWNTTPTTSPKWLDQYASFLIKFMLTYFVSISIIKKIKITYLQQYALGGKVF